MLRARVDNTYMKTPAHTTTAPEAIAASSAGALAGFEIRCTTCGDTYRNTVRWNVEADARAHVAYFAARKAR